MYLTRPSWHSRQRDRLRRFGHLLILAKRGFFLDDGPSWAAAIAYYSLLSLFPLLLLVGSIAAFFVEPQWAVQKATSYLGDLLPKGSGAIERVVQESLEAGRGPGLLSILPLLWTGTLVFNALSKALNIAFESEDSHQFGKRILVRFLMLLSLGGMFLAALASSLLLRVLRSTLGILSPAQDLFFAVIVNLLPSAFMLVAFFLAYRLVPARRPDWRAALTGAAVAAVFFTVAKPLFLGYVRNLASYNLVYGSLAGMIVVVLWTWVVAMIGLYGGQIATRSQSMFVKGSDVERARRRKKDRR